MKIIKVGLRWVGAGGPVSADCVDEYQAVLVNGKVFGFVNLENRGNPAVSRSGFASRTFNQEVQLIPIFLHCN